MNNRKPKITVVKDKADWGVYVWRRANGKVFGDGEGNIMNVKATFMDLQAIAKITDAAKAYGVAEGGKAEFWAACRPVSDMEASEQKDRLKQGYIPSETDFGAWEDALRGYKAHGSD